jgi:hypothetical protein
MTNPPFEDGVVHVTVELALDPVAATTFVGTPGTSVGVNVEADVAEELVPAAFIALTRA